MSDKIAFEPYLEKFVRLVYSDNGQTRVMKGVVKDVTDSFLVLKTLTKCYSYRLNVIQRVCLIETKR